MHIKHDVKCKNLLSVKGIEVKKLSKLCDQAFHIVQAHVGMYCLPHSEEILVQSTFYKKYVHL